MAYLDGELAGDRAALASAHLTDCPECQRLALDLKVISRNLREWKVEAYGAGISQAVSTVADEERRPRWPVWLRAGQLVPWAAGVAACMVVAIGVVRVAGTNANTLPADSYYANHKQFDRLEQFGKLQKVPLPSAGPQAAGGGFGDAVTAKVIPAISGPMIIRTAELAVTVQGFDQARGALEQVLRRHGGYVGNLQVTAPYGNPRTLAGKLRVPADQLDAVLGELKKLGRVDTEAQTGEEVTAAYVDLQARLENARNTEQRLTVVLQQRTGKLMDVLAVEKEIARVRGEIESMEAERKNMATEVAFATLDMTLTEDYKAPLETVPPSTLNRFRNSAVDGYQTMTEGVVRLLTGALFYAPSLLLWGGLCFFPARFCWRKFRARFV